MNIKESTQVRKLPPSYISQLSLILDSSEQWKKFMAMIPDRLLKNSFDCSISCENPAAYSQDQIKFLEEISLKVKRSASEILFDEWGCRGRVLPTVGHLRQILSTAELYRAADYVSEKILHGTSVKRPSLGPAAKVSMNFNGNIEENLEGMKFSSSLIENINFTSLNNNLNRNNEMCIPPIVITPDADILVENPMSITNNAVVSSLDLIEFSKDTSVSDTIGDNYNQSTPEIPPISFLLDSSKLDEQHVVSNGIQDFIQSNDSVGENSFSRSNLDTQNNILPLLSNFNQSKNINMKGDSETFLPKLDEIGSSSIVMGNNVDFLPNVSGLNASDSSWSQTISQNEHGLNESNVSKNIEERQSTSNTDNYSSINMPAISVLMQSSSEDKTSECVEIEHINSNFSASMSGSNYSATLSNDSSIINSCSLLIDSNKLTVNTFDSSKSRKCNSPLPNLTLTTHLPHLKYEDLKASTNDFNEESFDGLERRGRLLGSGAFGKVFLAKGIFQVPIAVKKIILGNVEVVDIADRVTKQFINEVEVLSKFRHKNLVSLLGFSCDGCTYCLLYEYIPGGTLKDRLQNKDAKLTWQERLGIAMGTASAITYLHTAFSSPLIHRDVKTANILLDQHNKAKLGDFGITTLLNNENMNTSTFIGTSAYMAPEAMRGDISVKCDTFSFGVVLLELLTSLPPYEGSREGGDLITHVEEICEESIAPLLDTSAGSWIANGVNFGEEIYALAMLCIKEKKKRPIMVDVNDKLMITVSKL